jgi:hypothetical protein
MKSGRKSLKADALANFSATAEKQAQPFASQEKKLSLKPADDKAAARGGPREHADFLCMLETWEAGTSFVTATAVTETQAIAIARLSERSCRRYCLESGPSATEPAPTAKVLGVAHSTMQYWLTSGKIP